MSKIKRIGAIVLCAVMVALLVVGCNGNSTPPTNSTTSSESTTSSDSTTSSNSANPTEKREDYVLTYLGSDISDSSSGLDDKTGQYIYEKFGVKINREKYAGDWAEKCTLMLAAGDYPELMNINSTALINKYQSAGALLKLDDLLGNKENFMKRFGKFIPSWRLLVPDGGWYLYQLVPVLSPASDYQYDMIVRSDILEQQGWPEVLDEDSYINLMKKGLADNPKTNGEKTLGISFFGAESWGLEVLANWYDKGNYSEVVFGRSVIWDHVNEKFDDLMTHPYFYDAMKFWNRTYREGLLDPDSFTDLSAQNQEKLDAGRVLCVYYPTWGIASANQAFKKAGKENMNYVVMPMMLKRQKENGDKRVLRVLDSWEWSSMVITKNAKQPERIAEVLDWAASEEGQVMLGWGFEGEQYTIGADGKRVMKQEAIDKFYSKDKDVVGLQKYSFLGLTINYDANGQMYDFRKDEATSNLSLPARNKEVYSHYGWESITDPWKKNKNFGFILSNTGAVGASVIDPSTEEGKLETKLNDFRLKNMVPLIKAKSEAAFESLYQKAIENYKAMNPQIVVDAFNNKYKANMEKLNSIK